MVAPGKQEINLFIQEQGEHSPIPSIIKDFNTSQLILKVKATNLEKYCSENKIEQIDLLKMDCEGAEYEIFYNLSDRPFIRSNTFIWKPTIWICKIIIPMPW